MLVVLQVHQVTCFSLVISTNNGRMPVGPWLPSQKGCFLLWPQLHQTYLPGFMVRTIGPVGEPI